MFFTGQYLRNIDNTQTPPNTPTKENYEKTKTDVSINSAVNLLQFEKEVTQTYNESNQQPEVIEVNSGSSNAS